MTAAGGLDFEEAYNTFRQEIAVIAPGQWIPGLDADDVAAEMTVCLWKATQTWDPANGASFGGYWWSIWTNRKKDLLASAHASHRPPTVLVADVAVLDPRRYELVIPPEPPAGTTLRDKVVWELLASGESAAETRRVLEISKRAYYATIAEWRTSSIRDSLV